MKITVLVIISVIGIVSCSQSEWWQAIERKVDAENKAKSIPHVIHEEDGCKVYEFIRHHQIHYFTRCPGEKTSTDRTYQECHLAGKSNVCESKIETIKEE